MSSSKVENDVAAVSNTTEQGDIIFLMGGITKKNKRKKRAWSRKRIQKVKLAIRANNELLTTTDAYHRTPLLLGLLYNAPADVLIAMIEANPDALLVKDRAVLGNTFLHEAVTKKGVDMTVLIASIHACPKALSIPGSGGLSPISTALLAGFLSPTFIVEAAQACPEALEMIEFDGMTPLHHVMKGYRYGACHSNSHGKVREMLNKIARAMIEIYPQALAIQDREGQTPLHLGMKYGVMDSDILEAAIDARPDVVSIKTYQDQYTVLHTGIMHAAPDRVIISAINANPDALDIVNRRDDNPLWQAVRSCMAEGVLMAALHANPKAVKRKKNSVYQVFESEVNILELAVRHSAPVSFLVAVIQQYPEFLLENESGFSQWSLPLLHRMIRLQTHLDVLEEAIKAQPSILKMKDFRGETPLCFAARDQPRKDLFKLLLRYGPDMVDIPDSMGFTPLRAIMGLDKMENLLDAIKETKSISMSMVPSMDCSKRRFCSFFFNVVARRVDRAMVKKGSTRTGIPLDIWWNIFGMLCEDDLAGMSKFSYICIMLKSRALFS